MSKQRILTAQIIYSVVFKKTNLTETFIQRFNTNHLPEFKSAVKLLCYETIRHYLWLEDIWLQCIDKKPKDKMVQVILTQGLAEFHLLNKPAHVVVNEAINTAKKLKKPWASGLINAALRKAVETNEIKPSNEEAKYSHPQWWIDKIKSDWPGDWKQILIANNKKPPLWVRAKADTVLSNPHNCIKNAYQIEAQNIRKNKEFLVGNISVQDASAQLAAHIMNPQDGDVILDMCAAPGGKTCHLLELNNTIELDAVEIFPNRAKKIHENLERLGLNANVIIGDANNLKKGNKYNMVLLDAPCSASGIIRRQVDIKFLRQTVDFEKICQGQQQLLATASMHLANKGLLLYVTCSIFKQENVEQIKLFLKTHPEFKEIKLNYSFAQNCEYGVQILPGTQSMDGFYYCLLKKND